MIEMLKKIIWLIAIIFLFGGGMYYSYKLKFFQFRFFSILKKFLKSNSSSSKAFDSLSISLAARIGVGSLSGIALAIFLGGPGTIFWIWVSSLISAINVFCETYLGVKYNEKDGKQYKGGPAFYINKTLNKKKLACVYALCVILSYIIGFITIQSNTIVITLSDSLKCNKFLIAIILAVVCALSILRGLNGITKIVTKLIPFMGCIYVGLSIVIIFLNFEKLPYIIMDIIGSAFNFKAIGGGFFSVLVIGIQRGIFCTEAGLGTGSIATSSANPVNKIDFSLGQIIGIYFTVFVVCTSTALIILTTDYISSNILVANGIELTSYALEYHFGSMGRILLILLVIFLSYTTIIAGYYYGESNLKYLIKNYKEWHIYLLKIITLLLLLIGSIINSGYLWNIIDIFVAILAIINMIVILKNRKEIIFDFRKNNRK